MSSELTTFLEDDAQRQSFRSFLCRSHCEENLNLWTDCRRVLVQEKPTGDAHFRRLQRACETIFRSYVVTGAPQQVNLDEQVMSAFQTAIASLQRLNDGSESREQKQEASERLSEAVRNLSACCAHLMTDSYRRFLAETCAQDSPQPPVSVTSGHEKRTRRHQHAERESASDKGWDSNSPRAQPRRSRTSSALSPRGLRDSLSPRWARRHNKHHKHASNSSSPTLASYRPHELPREQATRANHKKDTQREPPGDVAQNEADVEQALSLMLTQLRADLRAQSRARTPLFDRLTERQTQLREQAMQRLKVMQVMVKAQENLRVSLEQLAMDAEDGIEIPVNSEPHTASEETTTLVKQLEYENASLKAALGAQKKKLREQRRKMDTTGRSQYTPDSGSGGESPVPARLAGQHSLSDRRGSASSSPRHSQQEEEVRSAQSSDAVPAVHSAAQLHNSADLAHLRGRRLHGVSPAGQGVSSSPSHSPSHSPSPPVRMGTAPSGPVSSLNKLYARERARSTPPAPLQRLAAKAGESTSPAPTSASTSVSPVGSQLRVVSVARRPSAAHAIVAESKLVCCYPTQGPLHAWFSSLLHTSEEVGWPLAALSAQVGGTGTTQSQPAHSLNRPSLAAALSLNESYQQAVSVLHRALRSGSPEQHDRALEDLWQLCARFVTRAEKAAHQLLLSSTRPPQGCVLVDNICLCVATDTENALFGGAHAAAKVFNHQMHGIDAYQSLSVRAASAGEPDPTRLVLGAAEVTGPTSGSGGAGSGSSLNAAGGAGAGDGGGPGPGPGPGPGSGSGPGAEDRLCYPLMALVDVCGYRVLATAPMPVIEETLVYGSLDGGETVLKSDEGVNRLMEASGRALRLRPHWVGSRSRGGERSFLYAPGDVEVHRGLDGRAYLLDASRVLPPEAPIRGVRNSRLHCLLRVEYVCSAALRGAQPPPLCPDAFSRWLIVPKERVECNADVKKASAHLSEVLLPGLRDRILEDDAGLLSELLASPDPLPLLVEHLHAAGINLRFLGQLRGSIDSEGGERHQPLRYLLLGEMLARHLAMRLRAALRQQRTESVFGASDRSTGRSAGSSPETAREAVARVLTRLCSAHHDRQRATSDSDDDDDRSGETAKPREQHGDSDGTGETATRQEQQRGQVGQVGEDGGDAEWEEEVLAPMLQWYGAESLSADEVASGRALLTGTMLAPGSMRGPSRLLWLVCRRLQTLVGVCFSPQLPRVLASGKQVEARTHVIAAHLPLARLPSTFVVVRARRLLVAAQSALRSIHATDKPPSSSSTSSLAKELSQQHQQQSRGSLNTLPQLEEEWQSSSCFAAGLANASASLQRAATMYEQAVRLFPCSYRCAVEYGKCLRLLAHSLPEAMPGLFQKASLVLQSAAELRATPTLATYQRAKVYLFHVLKALEDAQPEELLSNVQQAGDLFLSVIQDCTTHESANLERKATTYLGDTLRLQAKIAEHNIDVDALEGILREALSAYQRALGMCQQHATRSRKLRLRVAAINAAMYRHVQSDRRYKDARNSYRQLLDESPGDLTALLGLGHLLSLRHERDLASSKSVRLGHCRAIWQEMLSCLVRASRAAPSNPGPRLMIARALCSQVCSEQPKAFPSARPLEQTVQSVRGVDAETFSATPAGVGASVTAPSASPASLSAPTASASSSSTNSHAGGGSRLGALSDSFPTSGSASSSAPPPGEDSTAYLLHLARANVDCVLSTEPDHHVALQTAVRVLLLRAVLAEHVPAQVEWLSTLQSVLSTLQQVYTICPDHALVSAALGAASLAQRLCYSSNTEAELYREAEERASEMLSRARALLPPGELHRSLDELLARALGPSSSSSSSSSSSVEASADLATDLLLQIYLTDAPASLKKRAHDRLRLLLLNSARKDD